MVRATESVKTGEEQPRARHPGADPLRPDGPDRIVTDDSHTGRDVTLWIVAVKFVVGGAVLAWFGVRRLRAR